jgi:hypothetical protein
MVRRFGTDIEHPDEFLCEILPPYVGKHKLLILSILVFFGAGYNGGSVVPTGGTFGDATNRSKSASASSLSKRERGDDTVNIDKQSSSKSSLGNDFSKDT